MMGRYENAILIADSPNDKNEILSISTILGIVSLTIAFILATLSSTNLTLFFNIDSKIIFISIPIIAFLMSYNNLLINYQTSNGNYNIIGKSKIICAIVIVLTQVSLYKYSYYGLILGSLVGYSTSLIYMILMTWKHYKLGKLNKNILIKYKNYPKYDMLSSLMNALSNQLPNIMLTRLTNANVLGNYSLMYRNIMAPIGLLISSISLVLKKELFEAKNDGFITRVFYKLTIVLIIISIPPTLILSVYGSEVFEFVFGEEWITAGKYAELFAPLILFKIVVSPLSYVLYIYQKQKIDMKMQFLYLLATIVSLYILNVTKSIELFINSYVGFSSAIYISYYLFCIKLIKDDANVKRITEKN